MKMIIFDNIFGIDSDGLQYMVGRIDKKTGKLQNKRRYYSNIEGALTGLSKVKELEQMKNFQGNLKEAIREIAAIHDEFNRRVDELTAELNALKATR